MSFMLFLCVRFFYDFTMESSIIVFTRERLLMLFMCLTLFVFLLGKICLCFSDLHVQCTKVK